VFLVLVDGDLIIPYLWGWVEADKLDPKKPADHDAGRFTRRLI
jgi:hypothetical protein